MTNIYSIKLVCIVLGFSIGVLFLNNGCASSKEIKNYVYKGISDCDTTEGYALRNFDARLNDSIKIWELTLNKGSIYKFMVFDRNYYKKNLKPKKTVSAFLSLYYGNDNKKICDENFINSTSKTDSIKNCFVFDCNKSGVYYLTIRPIKGKQIERTIS